MVPASGGGDLLVSPRPQIPHENTNALRRQDKGGSAGTYVPEENGLRCRAVGLGVDTCPRIISERFPRGKSKVKGHLPEAPQEEPPSRRCLPGQRLLHISVSGVEHGEKGGPAPHM